MLVIKVELHNANTHQISTIGRLIIANDGTGDSVTGNYDAALAREGQEALAAIWKKPARKAHVADHPRASSVWVLVSKALIALGFDTRL